MSHLLSHLRHETYKCPVENCGLSFSTSQHLERHRCIYHYREVYYSCMHPDCLFYSQSEEEYREHLSIHLRTKEYIALEALVEMSKVNVCPVYTPAHKEPGSNYICRIDNCDRSYSRKANLVRHQKQSHPGRVASLEIIIEN